MHEDVHDVLKDLKGQASLRLVGDHDKLDAQQRDQDEGGSHGLHVEARLGLVGHFQLGDENPHDVQQEKEVHLKPNGAKQR